ncbi:MAG: PhoX family protein [bacterium]|nr:PhoX family protein [bacterium]
MSDQHRRSFLTKLSASATAAAIGSAFSELSGRLAFAESSLANLYGELVETPDQTTGESLLRLPEGFRYWSYGWTNQPMSTGEPTPGAHDGMAVISEMDDQIVLCRNHEIGSPGSAFWKHHAYDGFAAGGCTNLVFDRKKEVFIDSRPSLAGTVKNCAGGATPWNTWLSCEETVVGPETKLDDMDTNPLQKSHGYVFEVPVAGQLNPKPLLSLGRFVHEAVAVDPETHIVYLTEDAGTAGLYRFLPERKSDLGSGRFQMLCARQALDVRKGVAQGSVFDVSWVDIPDRLRAHSPGTQDGLGVFQQGRERGGLTFARLEGVAIHDGKVFITATSGGDAEAGQVWQYDPKQEQLRLLFESPSSEVLDMPDNMCVSIRGDILLCEDGDYVPQRLQLLTPDGKLSPFAENNLRLNGMFGHSGDFRGSELAGATFSKDGQWLFVNIQTPGVTLAITGPWKAV